MSKSCFVTKKKLIFGNSKSHSMKNTKRKFYANLQSHKFWVKGENKFIKILVSKKGIKTIDKIGIENFLKKKN